MTDKDRLRELIERIPEGCEREAEIRLLALLAGLSVPLQPPVGSEADEDGKTPEDRAWMDADLSHLGDFEPYEWGPSGPPEGRPIEYVPGRGFVVR